MRYSTLAWFYNADDTLLHIRYLEYDPNTPNRSKNDLFGGLPIIAFQHKLSRETRLKIRKDEYIDFIGKHVIEEIPYYQDELISSAQLEMEVNSPITELFRHMTKGEPLTKIVVRQDVIDDSGRMKPFMQYTFKECWISEHKIDAPVNSLESYRISFNYCCLDLHYFEGNRFASHERCKPTELSGQTVYNARYRENQAQEKALKDQQRQEASRLAPLYPEYAQGTPVIHRFDVRASSEFNGKQINAGGLDEIAFHIVETGQTVDALIDFLYDKPSEVTRAHFKRVNKHLGGGIVLPAQVVVISPEDKMRLSESDFLAMARLDEIEVHRQNLKIDPLTFSQNFINYANAAGHAANGISFGTTYFQTHTKQIQKVLDELQEAYTKTFRMPGGSLKMTEIIAYRKKKYLELDSLLTRSMQAKLYGGMRHPNLSRRVKINAKTIEHDWRIRRSRVIPNLSQFYGNTVAFANALKIAGRIAIPLAAYTTYDKIIEACTAGEEACEKAQYVEWSGFAGGLIGGGVSGSLAGAGIAVLMAPAAVGGLVAVGIIAGVSIGAGYGGGVGGEYLMRMAGELLYESNHAKATNILVETIGDNSRAGLGES